MSEYEFENEFEDEEELDLSPDSLNDITENEEENDVDLSTFFSMKGIDVNLLDFNNLTDLEIGKSDVEVKSRKTVIVPKSKRLIKDLLKKRFKKTIKIRKKSQKINKKDALDLSNYKKTFKSKDKIFDLKTKKIKNKNIFFETKIFYLTKKINFLKEKIFYKKTSKKQFKTISVKKQKIYRLFSLKNMKTPHKIAFWIGLIIFIFALNIFSIYQFLYSWGKNLSNIYDSITEKNITLENTFKDITHAKSNFSKWDLLASWIYIFDGVWKNDYIWNFKNWVKTVKFLSSAWEDLVKIYKSFEFIKEKKWIENIMFSQFLENIDKDIWLDNILYKLEKSREYLAKIDYFPNEKIENIYKENIQTYDFILDFTKKIFSWKDIILSMLWNEEKKTYLVMFQNQDELRPMWGFMWSAAIIEVFKWQIVKLEKKDIYALEWPLKPFKEVAPEWINKLTPTFWLRDANYYIQPERSSQKIKSFVDNLWYDVDGIVYINQNILLDFLDEYWSFDFKSIQKEISRDNFSLIISTLVESKVSKEWTLSTPKQILFNFADEYFSFLKEKWDFMWYYKLLLNSIEKKDIIFYSFSKKENEYLENFWFNNFNNNFWDYIDFNYPYFTSISWNKSDRYINKSYIKNVEKIKDTCDYKTEFKIIQNHNFDISQEIYVKDLLYTYNIIDETDIEKLLEIQGKWDNYQFVRIIIPKNAEVSPKEGIIVTEFENYKEVNFYQKTNNIVSSKTSFEYILKNPNCLKYNYKLFKQPWITTYDFQYTNKNSTDITQTLDKDFEIK